MAQSRADRDSIGATGGDTGDDEATTGAPRWVKAFAIIAVVLVLLVVVLLLSGGGHGPGRHASFEEGGGRSLGLSVAHGRAPR